MKLNKLIFLVPILLLITSCSSGGSSGSGSGTLSSIAVTSVNPSIYYVDATEQFTAIGTYSDNTTQNLTTSVVWNSSDTTVATISNTASSNGLVTSLAAGTTTIKASLGSVSGSTVLTVTPSTVTPNNVLTVTVNGSLCSTGSYPNKPCVSVTVCSPSTATCKTIDDILLDTGDDGLRIFESLLTGISLTQVTSGSGSLAECIQYADGSADWGPVQTAVVVLGNEPAVTVPIQVINSAFGTVPSSCGNPETSPSVAGYNGILGVGFFAQDCGSTCVNNTNNGQYYSCSGSKCTGTTAPLSSQVQNPVALLPLDNNGVIVELQSVSFGGSSSASGSLVLGIGTQSNNTPSTSGSMAVTTYPTDDVSGEFTTTFKGSSLTESFIDTGSNGLFFPSITSSYNLTSQLPDCTNNPGWFCPAVTPPATVAFSATIAGASGSPSGTVTFNIGNADDLFSSSSNNVFVEVGAEGSTGSFDWGLPFYFGRYVYIGIEGTSSVLGTGPYFAY
jgi:hypothetical protein